MFRFLPVAFLAALAVPAVAQPGSNQMLISDAFGAKLGTDARSLEASGFRRTDVPEDGKTYSAWYKSDHSFFDQIAIHAAADTTIIETIAASEYYDGVAPFVDLKSCERAFDGLVETIRSRYPGLRYKDDSAEPFNARFYKHVKSAIFSPAPDDWARYRHIVIQCHSGRIRSKSPKPILSIRYTIGAPELERIEAAAKNRESAKAKQELESQGLKIEDF